MDVVYPYRLAQDGIELRYSLRSLQNIPHEKVWLVGEKPRWIRNASYLPMPQNKAKWANARRNIFAVCENPDLSDDFLLMNDDFFIMKEMPYIPYHYRGSVDESIERYKNRGVRSNYVNGFIATAELLRWAGVTGPLYSYNLHIPMQMNKHKLIECIDFLRGLSPKVMPECFHLRTWYGNFWQVGGTPMVDVKVRGVAYKTPEDKRFLSTSNTVFNSKGEVYQTITKAFPNPSEYEQGGKDGLNEYPQPRIRIRSRLNF